jgi:acetoin utilization deacetylase AcuC-like enzyme
MATSDFDRYEATGTNGTLDLVTDASTYLPTLVGARLTALDDEPFDLVLLGAGVDCHEGNGGPWGITFEFLAHREVTIFSWAAARRVPVAFCLLGGYRSTDLGEEAVSRLHRIAIAAAAVANRGDVLDSQEVMELASTRDGTEGFCSTQTGRRMTALPGAHRVTPPWYWQFRRLSSGSASAN